MPYKCIVPFCKSNYDSSNKKNSVFSFPKNENLKQKWIHCIPRENLIVNKNSRVCESHFKESDVQRETYIFDSATGKKVYVKLEKPRLKEGAVPCIFKGCPPYLSKEITHRESRDEKNLRKEEEELSKAITISLEEAESEKCKYKFRSLNELSSFVSQHILDNYWIFVNLKDTVLFAHIDLPNPQITSSLCVNRDLSLSVFFKNSKLNKIGQYNFPCIVSDLRVIFDILDLLKKSCNTSNVGNKELRLGIVIDILTDIRKDFDEKKHMLTFLIEQIQLINANINQRTYNYESLVFYSLLYSISPHAYNFLRNSCNIIIPHPSTIKRLILKYNLTPMTEQTDDHFLNYIKQKAAYLKDYEKHVILLMDEIHLKPFYDYKGGSIIGVSFDCKAAAKSAYVFMIQSACSDNKDVVHILPVNTLDAHTLYEYIVKIVCGLESIGFNVFCVISDNNSINRKAMSYFSKNSNYNYVYPHPVDPNRPLFYMIDSVHLLKCIRNNWLNQKNLEKNMYYPKWSGDNNTPADKNNICTASMKTLKKMYEIESHNFVKYGYSLTIKSLNPTNLERQNVKLAIEIFNENLAEGLMILGKKHNLENYEGTANYIKIIAKWWDIFNVRSPFKGLRKMNKFQEPLTFSINDIKLQYMENMIEWLDTWKTFKMDTGSLSKETHEAITQTLTAMLIVTQYCVEELNFQYLLTGKFQTDPLEDRFGKYRQYSGSNYNITITQVFENESKIRMQNLMPLLKFQAIDYTDLNISNDNLKENFFTALIVPVNDADFEKVQDIVPILTYISGYCVFAVLKKNNCAFCEDKLTIKKYLDFSEKYILIRNLDRGTLRHPHHKIIYMVIHNYIILSKLLKEYECEFLKIVNQRLFAVNSTLNILSSKEICLDIDGCPQNHGSDQITKQIIWASTNIILKNFCKIKNNILDQKRKEIAESKSKKRKLQTLKN